MVKNEGKKTKQQAMRDKAMGLRSGVSDLIILGNKTILFMEVKTDTGRQSKAQVLFQSIVEKFGFKYVVVRNVKDVVDSIQNYVL
jgi:hypothetical protein